MRLILTIICLFLFVTNVKANPFEEFLTKEQTFCPLENSKDSQNDPCSPEIAVPAKEKDDAAKDSISPKGATKKTSKRVSKSTIQQTKSVSLGKIKVVFFWGEGCPHCAMEKPFLESLVDRFPEMEIMAYEVLKNKENALLFQSIASAYGIKASGVPATFIGNKAFLGFTEGIAMDIERAVEECSTTPCINPLERALRGASQNQEITAREGMNAKEAASGQEVINIPFIGHTDVSNMALPLMTLVIAGLDSFNPCAFFVLFSLLGLLIHAKSRKKMALIGGVFVFFSGFMYFLFMAAWLNFFLIMGEMSLITTLAGLVSVVIAGINIKDFFIFKKGVSLTISDDAKGKLFDKMRRLLRSTSTVSMLFGTIVLAVAANAYELLCTAGFPMVFTRILTLNNLPPLQYYSYLALYNLIYVIPLLVIVTVFTVSLGKRQLSEEQGRFLKLLSGLMMLGLGMALLIKPSLLNNVLISVLFLLGALLISLFLSLTLKAK